MVDQLLQPAGLLSHYQQPAGLYLYFQLHHGSLMDLLLPSKPHGWVPTNYIAATSLLAAWLLLHPFKQHGQNLSWLSTLHLNPGPEPAGWPRLTPPIMSYSCQFSCIVSIYLAAIPSQGKNDSMIQGDPAFPGYVMSQDTPLKLCSPCPQVVAQLLNESLLWKVS